MTTAYNWQLGRDMEYRFEGGGAKRQFAAVFNITGQPAVSLPLGQSASGVPIGVQLVAAPGREDVLLRIASQLEAAHPWVDRRPA